MADNWAVTTSGVLSDWITVDNFGGTGTTATIGTTGTVASNTTSNWTWLDTAATTCTSGAMDYQVAFKNHIWQTSEKTRRTKIQEMIARNMNPAIHVRRRPGHAPDLRESRGRQTLRRLAGERAYRCYLQRGFLPLDSPTVLGRRYLIRPGNETTLVIEHGKVTRNACVVLKGRFTPADSVIMRFLMLSGSEEQAFLDIALDHGMAQIGRHPCRRPTQALIDIFGQKLSSDRIAA